MCERCRLQVLACNYQSRVKNIDE